MRLITKQATEAFLNNKAFNKANTKVCPNNHVAYLYLYGNIIAIIDHYTGKIKISNGGWQSNTTKERLNALPGVRIRQRNGIWYLNGEIWNGGLIDIKR